MARFNVGDRVFVPNAVEWTWNPESTTIKEVVENNGVVSYYAECLHHNLASNSSDYERKDRIFKEHEVFELTKEGLESCKKHISNYYYDGLCKGCHYENLCGFVWSCKKCSHCKRVEGKAVTEPNPMRCELNGIVVASFYNGRGQEICHNFDPILPQDKASYVSWDFYNDVLINCEFNKECYGHKNSCHKTCSYDYYMNQKYVEIPLIFSFGNRVVKSVLVPRRLWINQSFLNGNILTCITVRYEYEKNKHGRPKKECLPIQETFDNLVKIDIKKGIIIGGEL